MLKIVLIYIICWKICGTESTNCPTECTKSESGETVEWSTAQANQWQFSQPMCLNKTKIPEKRFCNETSGDWNPTLPPHCETTQEDYKTMSRCPPDFIHLKNTDADECVCVHLSDATQWNDECVRYGSGKTIFDLSSLSKAALLDLLKSKKIYQFWIPANRTGLYDPIVWRLPVIWGDYVELGQFDNIYIGQRQEPGDCLSVQIGGGRLIAVFEMCTKKLPMLCVYQEKPLLRLGCGKNGFTTRYRHYQNICFTIVNLKMPTADSARVHTKCEQNVLYYVTSPEKNYIYQSLVDQMRSNGDNGTCSSKCAISVIPGQNTGRFSWTMWDMSLPKINFVGWELFPGDGSFVVNNCDGRWSFAKEVSCVACEQQIQILKPEITLIFKQEWGKLFVTVVNRSFLWREDNSHKKNYDDFKDDDTDNAEEDDRDDDDVNDDDDDDDEGDKLGIYCFTNGGKDILKKIDIGKRVWSGNISPSIHQIDTVKKEIYELEIENDGVYWCEGHSIPDFGLVQSKNVVAFSKSKGTTFATLIKYHCHQCTTQTNNRTALREISSNFETLLQSMPLCRGKVINSVRLIRIESVNKIRSTLQLLFHIKMAVSDEHEEDSSEEDELDEVGVPDDILEIYFLRKKMWLILKEVEAQSYFKVISMNHTQFCLPENLLNEEVNWISARINEKSVPKELCLQTNGVPVTRKCVGDFNYGGVWDGHGSVTCDEEHVSLITQKLYAMGGMTNYTEIQSIQAIRNISEIVKMNRSELIAADLFYMGRVLSTLSEYDSNQTDIHQELKTRQLTSILSNVMLVNETVIRKSQKLNTTNLILDAYNNIINKMSLSSQSLMQDGTAMVYMPKLIVFVTDPSVRNISGVALYRNGTGGRLRPITGDFNDYYVKPLYSDHYFKGEIVNYKTAGDVEDELEVASFVPEKLIRSLRSFNATSTLQGVAHSSAIKPPLRIVIALHYNDVLFQENVNVTTEKSASIIISVSIPGYDTNLRGFLPIYFRYDNTSYGDHSSGNFTDALCGYWDFSPENPDINSEWAKDGCKFQGLISVPNSVKICYCTHLTHFALLVQGHFVNDYDDENNYVLIEQMIHNEVLDVITLTGCSLSLVGIFGIYATALLFRSWREKANAKVLLQLSTAIALQMVLMCLVSSEAINIKIFTDGEFNGCIVFGASLQYSVLVVFSWMLITAYLQFVRYVRVLGNQRPSRFFLKSFIIGWCVPFIPVLLIIIIDPSSYIPPGVHDQSRVCYPSGYSLYFGVLLPIALIVIANLTIFILVIFSISRGPGGKIRTTERELTLSQLRLSIFLFFLLGLSWIFGLAVASKMGIVFSYLFCLTATLQGFVLFIYFIIMDPNTRKLWIDRFTEWGWGRRSQRNASK